MSLLRARRCAASVPLHQQMSVAATLQRWCTPAAQQVHQLAVRALVLVVVVVVGGAVCPSYAGDSSTPQRTRLPIYVIFNL